MTCCVFVATLIYIRVSRRYGFQNALEDTFPRALSEIKTSFIWRTQAGSARDCLLQPQTMSIIGWTSWLMSGCSKLGVPACSNTNSSHCKSYNSPCLFKSTLHSIPSHSVCTMRHTIMKLIKFNLEALTCYITMQHSFYFGSSFIKMLICISEYTTNNWGRVMNSTKTVPCTVITWGSWPKFDLT
jgi:hypothetical protein